MIEIKIDAGKWIPDELEKMYHKVSSTNNNESMSANFNGIRVIMFKDNW